MSYILLGYFFGFFSSLVWSSESSRKANTNELKIHHLQKYDYITHVLWTRLKYVEWHRRGSLFYTTLNKKVTL